MTQAGGDARRMLNALEVAADLAQGQGGAAVSVAMVEEALQQKTLLYDKAGDEHYGVVSAFIKSMRGSDPDAAVYWMTRMLEAGEEPRFVLRRMVIFAAEDIGNADPQALVVATAALAAFELVGLAGGRAAADPVRGLSGVRAQVEHVAHDLRGGAQGGARAGRLAGAGQAAERGDRAAEGDGPRARLQVPARVRGPLRGGDVSSRCAGRPALLPAERVGRREGDQGAPREIARSGW